MLRIEKLIIPVVLRFTEIINAPLIAFLSSGDSRKNMVVGVSDYPRVRTVIGALYFLAAILLIAIMLYGFTFGWAGGPTGVTATIFDIHIADHTVYLAMRLLFVIIFIFGVASLYFTHKENFRGEGTRYAVHIAAHQKFNSKLNHLIKKLFYFFAGRRSISFRRFLINCS